MKMRRTKDYGPVVDWWVPRVQGEEEILNQVSERTGLPKSVIQVRMLGVRLDYLLMAICPETESWQDGETSED